MKCPDCGAACAADARYCAACGRRLPSAGPEPEPYTTIEPARLGVGDWVALGGAGLLFIALLLPWYGWNVGLGWGTVSALGLGSGGWRFLILLDCVVIVLYLFFRTMAPRTLRLPLPHWQLLTVLTGCALLLTALTFLVRPSSGIPGTGVGMEYGAYLGAAAAVAAVAGSVMRRRESELCGGGRERAAPKDAPAPEGTAPPSRGASPSDRASPTDPSGVTRSAEDVRADEDAEPDGPNGPDGPDRPDGPDEGRAPGDRPPLGGAGPG